MNLYLIALIKFKLNKQFKTNVRFNIHRNIYILPFYYLILLFNVNIMKNIFNTYSKNSNNCKIVKE